MVEQIDVGNDPDLMRRIGNAAAEHGLGAHRTHHLARKTNTRLDLYEHGAVVVQRAQQLHVLRNDSARVSQKITRHTKNGVHTGTTHHYRVTDVNGAEVLLTEAICCPEQWGAELVEAIANRQAGPALEALQAGQRLDFGSWWLTSSQIGTGSKTFALQELRGFRVERGQVIVEIGEDTRISKGIDTVQNFLLFQFLLKQLLPGLPESAGKVFNNRLAVRGFNGFFAILAVIGFVIACLTRWPVSQDELCDKFATVQNAGTELTHPVEDLQKAAKSYRGEQQSGVRTDADRLSKYTTSGFHWVNDQDLDNATPTIRAVCHANSFSTRR